MAKLIGTGVSQVPTNGDLGDLAYQNKESVNIEGGTITADSITTAELNTTGNITFGDNDKAIFGAGSDLQIYHDGLNSYIDEQGNGGLNVRGTNLNLTDSAGVRFLRGESGGPTRFYHQGTEVLTSTSTGIDVTGTVTADGLTVDGNNGVTISGNYPAINLGETDTTDQNSRVRVSAGDFRIDTIDDAYANGKTRFLMDNATGDISFYEDTGTTAKFFWDASAESLGIGNTNPDAIIRADSGTANKILFKHNPPSNRYFSIAESSDGTYDNAITTFYKDATVGQFVFETAAAERMRIDSSGTLITYYASVFNENGGDYDFRVESDTNTHALFVNAGNSRVGINDGAPESTLHVRSAGTAGLDLTQALTVEGYGTGNSGDAACIAFAAGDATRKGAITFTRNNSYGRGYMSFLVDGAADSNPPTASEEVMRINSNSVVINESGASTDFRVESNNNSSALFVDASEDRVTLGGSVVVDTENAGNRARSQTITGQATAAASGTPMKFVRTGHSGVFDVQIFVSHPSGVSSGSGMYQGTFCMTYGAGGLKSSPCTQYYNAVSGISVAYNNGGSPVYTLDVTVTYTGTAPNIYWTVTGKTDISYNLYNVA
jgi:hypothetical protein